MRKKIEKIVWKIHPEFTKYEVSNQGLVRNALTKRIRAMSRNESGYLETSIGGKSMRIHRLVAQTFIQNDLPDIRNQVNHKNGNKLDNAVDNLEWVTIAENNRHAAATNLVHHGERSSKTKLTEDQVIEMRKRFEAGGISKYRLAKIYGISANAVGFIISRRNWRRVR